jgi:hypothetical protein
MINTPLKAIKARCIDCCGDDHPRKCVCTNCALYPFRLGKNTLLTKKKVSNRQREILLKNMQKRWEK